MDDKLIKYLRNLKAYGVKNNIPNVTETVGRFLNMLIKIHKPKNILEIGCANGYSTIWMADAAKTVGGMIHSIDFSRPSMAEAKNNLLESGLSDSVNFIFDNALKVIPKLSSDLRFDFVFIDGQKAMYLDFWNAVKPVLNLGAVIVFDDMIAFQAKTKTLSDALELESEFDKVLLPVDEGDGILLLVQNFNF